MSSVHIERLHRALESLQNVDPKNGIAWRTTLRATERAADDAECCADEASSLEERDSLLLAASSVRNAIRDARIMARKHAHQVARFDRAALLGDAEMVAAMTSSDSGAAKIARDITSSLRRTTAVVQDELARTTAAGEIVDDSSRRLVQTRDVHVGYSSHLDSGADTLRSLRRKERNADIVVTLCFFMFFLVAAYLTQRRLANSNVATFIVKPTISVATFPYRVFRALIRRISTFSDSDFIPTPATVPPSSTETHIASAPPGTIAASSSDAAAVVAEQSLDVMEPTAVEIPRSEL